MLVGKVGIVTQMQGNGKDQYAWVVAIFLVSSNTLE